MPEHRWIDWPADDCERCGDAVEVLTDAEQKDGDVWVCDGDEARCVSCGLKGVISCDSETEAWVNWEEEDDDQ